MGGKLWKAWAEDINKPSTSFMSVFEEPPSFVKHYVFKPVHDFSHILAVISSCELSICVLLKLFIKY